MSQDLILAVASLVSGTVAGVVAAIIDTLFRRRRDRRSGSSKDPGTGPQIQRTPGHRVPA